MGYFGYISAILVVGLAIYIAQTPSPATPVPWDDVPPLRQMNGPLEPNELLISTTHLHAENKSVVAPEAIAVTEDGNMFAGLANGMVIIMNSRGEHTTPVFHSGTFVAFKGEEVFEATGVDLSSRNGVDKDSLFLTRCLNEGIAGTLQRDIELESKCGRPLGLHWEGDSSTLYIADAYYGLFSWKKWQATHLFDSKKQLPLAVRGAPPLTASPPDAARATGPDFSWMVTKPSTLMNDLTIVPSGNIYITDTSWKHVRQENRVELFDAAPRGRLFRFNPKDGSLTTVMCGLHFPNGVELDQQKENLLVVESMRFRILRVPLAVLESDDAVLGLRGIGACYDTTGSSSDGGGGGGDGSGGGDGTAKGEAVTVWSSNIPGFADGMSFDAQTGSYLVGCGTKVAAPFSLLHLMFKLPPAFRLLLGKVVSQQTVEKLVPHYGLVVALDQEGTIVKSYQDPTGRTAFISYAVRNPKSKLMFLGSSQNFYLGRLFLP